ELIYAGHQVVVQAGAGSGCGFTDAQFAAAGAKVVGTADEVFAAADVIVKVKEPIPEEYHRFRPGQQLFTFLHLAADRRLTEFLLERRIVRVRETNPARLAYLSDVFGGRLDLVVPSRARTAAYVAESDVVVGAVLVTCAQAPKLLTREMIASMRPGSVVVDMAIDLGG